MQTSLSASVCLSISKSDKEIPDEVEFSILESGLRARQNHKGLKASP